ncbi:ribonuclease H-like domain-containing protein [Corynebacterium pseudokroppenstedtii]|uniref:ribonuclease H-like domain-containing protein n=1 Tax=Corynebacterium pseudokroppenstedtii TaxID=2804917 RepID=UPI00254CD1C8|nr:ribonuclease H-like domain-containing protein [Corynebacterium pseudokroppenstedtii]MDK7148193.1 ribonuclease H-like domain-containing protein [Corynebacterium pseudokroppenstedtii]
MTAPRLHPADTPVEATELSGCRYRIRQRRTFDREGHPRPPREAARARQARSELERTLVFGQLSDDGATVPGVGNKKSLTMTIADCVQKAGSTADAGWATDAENQADRDQVGTQPTSQDRDEMWDAQECTTLEALAEGIRVIINPRLTARIAMAELQGARPGVDVANPWWLADPTDPALSPTDDIIMRTAPDLLVRVDSSALPHEARYMPVTVSTHQGIVPDSTRRIMSVSLPRLGTSAPLWRSGRAKTHSGDIPPLVAAHYALRDVGSSSDLIGIVGQGAHDVAVWPVGTMTDGFVDAVRVPISTQPRKIKACRSCRFERDCHTELKQMDDISLVLHGARADKYRLAGISTVHQLADAGCGDASIMAYAYTQGWTAVHRPDKVRQCRNKAHKAHGSIAAENRVRTDLARGDADVVRRADVEIDVDMEAYLERGCYLWGTSNGSTYRPFVTWQQLNSDAEARNFAMFWAWLMDQRDRAHARGDSFAAYCYGAQGENMWLKRSAQRFGGLTFSTAAYEGPEPAPATTVTVPTVAEVNQFIRSPEWVDVYAAVKGELVGPAGLGLKTVAPLAGFHWEDADMDGEASLSVFMQAKGVDPLTPIPTGVTSKHDARALLLRYNRDDCRATAVVRNWLTAGAPGAHTMPAPHLTVN